MRITEEQTIWFPGIYVGRTTTEWVQQVMDITLEVLTERVQRRAREDGEWAITNGFVGDNEANMRQMMAWVSDEKNIEQIFTRITEGHEPSDTTVDWVCRDLANGSRWVHGSHG